MRLFVYVMLAILCLDVIGKSVMLYLRYEERSMAHTAGDVVINAGLAMWAVYVLAAN